MTAGHLPESGPLAAQASTATQRQTPTQARQQQLIAAVAAVLAVGGDDDNTWRRVAILFLQAGWSEQVSTWVTTNLRTLTGYSGVGAAAAAARASEARWEAAYLAAAVQRLSDAAKQGQDALTAAEAREQTYHDQYEHAAANRRDAAQAVDTAARAAGTPGAPAVVLAWKTTFDSHTTAECAAANGKVFYASRPPLIGYPGSVHPHCRCTAVAPTALNYKRGFLP